MKKLEKIGKIGKNMKKLGKIGKILKIFWKDILKRIWNFWKDIEKSEDMLDESKNESWSEIFLGGI